MRSRRSSVEGSVVFVGKPGEYVTHYEWQYSGWSPLISVPSDRRDGFKQNSLASRALAHLALPHHLGCVFTLDQVLAMIGEEATDPNRYRLTCQLRRHRYRLNIDVSNKRSGTRCVLNERVTWREGSWD